MGKAPESRSKPKRPGTFPKGKSPNPGGRPRVAADVRELARKYTTEAIEKLASLMRKAKREETQKAAAEALLARGYGHPIQPTETTVAEELREALHLLRAKLKPAEYDRVLDALAEESGPAGTGGTLPTAH